MKACNLCLLIASGIILGAYSGYKVNQLLIDDEKEDSNQDNVESNLM